jgi:histidine triad (HIT) family protein
MNDHENRDNCLFCKIAKKQIPATLLYEDEDVVAFPDIAPQAPVHFLVIPKQHISHLMELTPEHDALVGKMLRIGQQLAKEQGLENDGARFVMNCKEGAGQTVFHIHLHVLGGRALQWPPG